MECLFLLQAFKRGKERELAVIEGLLERRQEQVTELPGENPNRQEEPVPARDPAAAVGRQPAAGHHAMQMGVMQQVLAPGVEDGEEADLRPQVFGIRRDRVQRLGGRAEENVVDDLLVLIGDGGDLLGHGEDHVEVLHIEDLGAAVVQPLGAGQRLAFRAVPVAATVVRDALVPAGVALLDMAAERRRPATLDRRHDATLRRGQRVPLTIGITIAAEHLRHLRPRPGHRRRA